MIEAAANGRPRSAPFFRALLALSLLVARTVHAQSPEDAAPLPEAAPVSEEPVVEGPVSEEPVSEDPIAEEPIAAPSESEAAAALALPLVDGSSEVVEYRPPLEGPELPPGARVVVAPPTEPAEPAPFEGRAYPVRYARRPLTVGEGALRIDTGSSGRFSSGITATLAFGMHLGITANLEAGFSWALYRDPSLHATYRFDVDENVDLGVRVSVRMPIVTTGNTVLRVGVPLVVRGGDWFRLQTGVDLDLLFESNVSPLFEVPLQIAFSPMDRGTFGFEGWLGVLNGSELHGRVGTFVAATGHTPLRALFDIRFGAAYLIGERAFEISSGVSFYPQLW